MSRHALRSTGFSLLAALTFAAQAAAIQVQVNDGAGRPLPDAVVYLESRDAAAAAKPARDVAIAQVDKQFSPRVTIVSVGTPVDLTNRDKVRHHVYSFSAAKTFELKLYTGKPGSPVVFDRPGIAVLGCNIHDQMSAWVVVVETPYYAKTGANGQALIDGVPPGTYRLRTWHAALPVGAAAADQPIAVAAANAALVVPLAEVGK